ncbi:MAG TPA: DUF4386 domain-containing protein, partial [Cytophagales bacterium]|nr:DUF4386 domain-containing protein [Cytophagales bacterium]
KTDTEVWQAMGHTLKSIHDWTFILGPNFMLGINTLLYSSVFYQSKLISKPLALLGIIASLLILVAAVLEMFGIIAQLSMEGVALAFPIFAYEMILAVRLLIKGFDRS